MIPILIDTREQRPWDFADPFEPTRATLRTGDYALAEYPTAAVIERKSLGDFVGTVIGDWLRFRKALYRLAAFDHAVIVVEASVADVLAHRYDSEAEPASVLGRAHACLIDHGVSVAWWSDRATANQLAAGYFAQLHRKLGGRS